MNEAQQFNQNEMQFLYDIQQASVARTKTPFSIVFVSLHENSTIEGDLYAQYEALFKFVASHARNTDRVYRHPSYRFVIVILPFSGNDEAQAYFNRLVAYLPKHELSDENNMMNIIATTNEIANSNVSLREVIDFNIGYFEQLAYTQPNVVYTIKNFSTFNVETIRVSILENNAVAMSILQNSIQNLSLPNFDLQLQTYSNGLDFMNSEWHLSGHTHIVITNDTLPFKNGLEIVSYLRSLPNDEKYIIMLISKRSMEEAVIYAYTNGVDAYFTRPFNIRLLEAKMKSIIKRLR